MPALAAPRGRSRTPWCRPRPDPCRLMAPAPCTAAPRPASSCPRRRGRPGRRCGSSPVGNRFTGSLPLVGAGRSRVVTADHRSDRAVAALGSRWYVCEFAPLGTCVPAVPGDPDVRRTLAQQRRAGPAARRRTTSAAPASPPTTSPRSASSWPSAAAVAIGNGALRARPAAARAHRRPRRARRRRGQGLGHRLAPRARSSTRSPTASPTPSCSAAWPGTWRPPSGGRIAVLPLAVLGAVDAHLLRAGQGRVARLRRPGRAHGAGRAPHRSSASACCSTSLLVPVLWVMLVLTAVHRRPAVREGVAPGRRAPAAAPGAPAGGTPASRRSAQRPRTWRARVERPAPRAR